MPSIRLESTASFRTYMRTNNSGFGRVCTEPSSRPNSSPACASAAWSSPSRAGGGSGGSGLGMNAR